MRVHGVIAHRQIVGDLFHGQIPLHQFQNFLLSLRQAIIKTGLAHLPIYLQDGSGHLGAHRGSAGEHLLYGFGNLFRRRGFEQIAGSTGANGLENFFVVVKNREHDDPGGG